MYPELTNLLPESRKRDLRRTYLMRLATMGTLLVAGAVVIHGLLLVPGYLYVHTQVKAQSAQIAALADTFQTSQEKEIVARVNLLRSTAAYLGNLETVPNVSSAIRAILGVARPGISLEGFTFNGPVGTSTVATMTVSGKAASRDGLRSYVNALGQLSFVSGADLPIGAYAKETDIPFLITLTGSMRP